MSNSTQELTIDQARTLANKEWTQYRRFTYVSGNTVVVRDNDENMVAVYPFVAPTKAKQLTLGF